MSTQIDEMATILDMLPELFTTELREALKQARDKIEERLRRTHDGRTCKMPRPEVLLKLGIEALIDTTGKAIIHNNGLCLYVSRVIIPLLPAELLQSLFSARSLDAIKAIEEFVAGIDTSIYYRPPTAT